MELTPEQLSEIAGKVATALKPQIETTVKAAVETAGAAAAEAQKTAIEAATKPLAEKIAAIEAAPAKGKKGKADDDGEDDADPVLAKLTGAIEAAIKPLSEQVAALQKKDADNTAANTKAGLIEATLKAKFPNLKDKQREVVVRRLSSMDLKDAAGVEAAMKNLQTEYADAGVDVTPFAASVAAEGGETGKPKSEKEKWMEKVKSEGKAASVV